MNFLKNKSAMIISTLLILSIAASIILTPSSAQVTPPRGSHVPTYAFINVAPNPAGIGQTVTINFFLATPLETSGEFAVNMSY